MCTVILPLGVNPIAVDRYIISHHFSFNVTSLYIPTANLHYESDKKEFRHKDKLYDGKMV